MSYKSCRILDSHCHLFLVARNNASAVDSYQNLINLDFLSEVWDIGIRSDDYEERRDLLGKFPWLYFSIGLHPSGAHEQTIDQDQWFTWTQDEKVILIGEMGLDYSKSRDFEKVQKKAFIQQIEIANLVKKPIVVHVRGADQDFLDLVREYKPVYGGVWHCFSSNYRFAKKALDLGFKISFSGNITYKKVELIHEAAQKLPIESILIETDAPYLSPLPKRGKPNHSENLIYTLQALSKIRKESPQELSLQISKNGNELLGRNPSP